MSASGTPEGVEGEEREKGAREGETNSAMKGRKLYHCRWPSIHLDYTQWVWLSVPLSWLSIPLSCLSL